MAEIRDTSQLPPGWERKYDHNTRKPYFLNHFNKTTTWEDPTLRYRQLAQAAAMSQHMTNTAVESIPLQHGTPDLRGYLIYPSNSSVYPPQPAFQNPAPYSHTSIHFQDMSNSRPSPIPGRAFSHLGGGGTAQPPSSYGSPARSVTQIGGQGGANSFGSPARSIGPFGSPVRLVETSLTVDPEQSVAKISSMFPTVTENHIKSLLMKYLKSVFPKADETLLLDTLNNSDNNVQKASEALLAMGFEKRDTPPPRLTLRKKEEEARALREKQLATPVPPPRMKSHEEKQKMKGRLQTQYKDIPERVVTIALESVDYDEDRAAYILQIMVQEDGKPTAAAAAAGQTGSNAKVAGVVEAAVAQAKPHLPKPEPTPAAAIDSSTQPVVAPEKSLLQKVSCLILSPEKSDKLFNKRPKGKKDIPKVSRGTSTTEDKEYKSPYLLKVCGPSHDLCRGPNDELLLSDYITWNGPNHEILSKTHGKISLAKGPNKSIQKGSAYIPKGSNTEFWKGPKKGLAKGSIYSQLSAKNAANESRSK